MGWTELPGSSGGEEEDPNGRAGGCGRDADVVSAENRVLLRSVLADISLVSRRKVFPLSEIGILLLACRDANLLDDLRVRKTCSLWMLSSVADWNLE